MSAAETALSQLVCSLPTANPDGASVEDQARSVLLLLVERVAACQPDAHRAIPPDPATCPNCGVPVDSLRSPYCGDSCRETAAFVRQFRSGLAEGTIFDKERQVAFGQNLWFLLGGGRPLRQALAPERSLRQVLKREGGRCQECGAPATTFDHTGSG